MSARLLSLCLVITLGMLASPVLAQSTNATPIVIQNTNPVDLATLPLNDDNKKLLQGTIDQLKAGTYLNSIFVSSANGALTTYYSSVPTLRTGLAETARVALEICEYFAKAPCIILAVNGHDARDANGDWPVQPKMLDYDPGSKLDVWRTPFNSQINRTFAGTLPDLPSPEVVVVSTAGGWTSSSGKSIFEAIDTALANCQKTYPNNVCILYSVNGRIVMAQ